MVAVNSSTNPFDRCIQDCEEQVAKYKKEYDERTLLAKFNLSEYFSFNDVAQTNLREANEILGDKDKSSLTGNDKIEYDKAIGKYKKNNKIAKEHEIWFSIHNSAASDRVSTMRKWNNQLMLANKMKSIFSR